MNKIKVHPNVAAASLALPAAEKGEAVSLTVWRRSLLFNGKGFTVFDTNGNLVFRVETHSRGSPREVVLMDAHGVAILTVRRKPDLEPALAMAVVILLDQMNAS
ncbi:Protein LURP-one-related 8 [Triticum urartu]|uniref:Protein LURP-one-related 8 n=1 Tax=Triticum urartu TaxID=4572 RepID=M7YL65_TRIUA|nr:Protein LURP-one-related 8 [Triticum urartu]